MRTLKALLISLVVLSLAPGQHSAQTKADPKKLIDEYLAEQTSSARRGEITAELELQSGPALAPHLKKALADKAVRVSALRLATLLQVRGLFESARKMYDEGEHIGVGMYGLLLDEKGAADFLHERWVAAPLDSDEFDSLHVILQMNSIPLSTLKRWVDWLKKDKSDKRPFGAEIISCQFGDPVTDADEVLGKWPDWEKAYKSDAAAQSCAGLNLRLRSPWVMQGHARHGMNLRIAAGGGMENPGAMPPSAETGKFSLGLTLFVHEGTECELTLVGKDPAGSTGGYPVAINGKNWRVITSANMGQTGELATGKWVTFLWEVTRPSSEPDRGDFDVATFLDGKKICDRRPLKGRVEMFQIKVASGLVTVGPLEYLRK